MKFPLVSPVDTTKAAKNSLRSPTVIIASDAKPKPKSGILPPAFVRESGTKQPQPLPRRYGIPKTK